MRRTAVLLATSVGTAVTASSQTPSAAPPTVDPAWKVAEVIAFIGLKKGDQVADVIAGRLTASLATAICPSGRVYALETAEMVKNHPDIMSKMNGLAAHSPNLIVSDEPITSALPSGLDAVFIRQNYHDLYDKFMGPVDVDSLRQGGVRFAKTRWRICRARSHRRCRLDVLAAGSTLDAESSILANASDDHTKNVFDPAVRGHTDQFLMRFKKPE